MTNRKEMSLKASSAELRDDVMDRLWTRMAAIYGHRWNSSYGMIGESGYETWRAGLGDLTPSQVRKAVGACVQRNDGWPPTLPEFRAMCLHGDQDEHRTNAAMYRRPEFLALPKPKATYDKARPFVQSLRSNLGGVKHESEPKAEPFRSDPERRKRIQAELDKAMQTVEQQP